MAQQRFRNYKHSILSFEHNKFKLGFSNPGRFCGFDTLTQSAPLQFSLAHTGTGVSYKNQINVTIGPVGALMTPQGICIHETAAIGTLTVDTNAGNAETRFDLIVCNHSYTVNPGGDAATYAIIKGPTGSPIKPILTDPLKQTILGFIEFPPDAVNLADCTYYVAKCPDSGDGEDARLHHPNLYSKLQGFAKSQTTYLTNDYSTANGGHSAHLWQLVEDGNLFVIQPTESTQNTVDGIKIKNIVLQEGIRINLLINEFTTLRESRYFEAGAFYAQGFRSLVINAGLGNYTIPIAENGGGSGLGIRPSAGELWDVEMVYIGTRWFVTKIGGAGTSSAFRKGDTIFWYGDIASNFDDSGTGINLKAGWQICNGNLQTPDLRGKALGMGTQGVPFAGQDELTEVSVGAGAGTADVEDYIFSTVFTTVGKTKFLITQNNLPDVNFPITDPGHQHTYQRGAMQSHPGGNNVNRPQLYETANTGVAFTGIAVNSGGADERLEHIQPCWMGLLIMKL